MENFNHLFNKEIDNIDEIKKNLRIQHFIDIDVEMFYKNDFAYFHDNGGYYPLCVKIIDKETNYIHGFILVGNKSILENKELQSNLYMYENETQGFKEHLSKLKGCCIIGYGFDNRVVSRIEIEKMINQICFSLQYWYESDFKNLIYDYVWLDCTLDKAFIYQAKYGMESLKNNANLFYK